MSGQSAANQQFMKPGMPQSPRGKTSAIPFPVKVPFVESLGIELHAFSAGLAELHIDLDAGHLNTWEVAHGGVVMTMLDVAMAMASRSVSAAGVGVATVEMKTSFLRPAEHRLRALAKVLHKTATLVFCEASLYDDQDQLCAHATGTFKALRGLPTRQGVVNPLVPTHPLNPPPAKDSS